MTLFEKEQKLFLHTYKRINLDIDFCSGVYLFDKSGRKYLDFFSGLAVNALGYAHPEIVRAVSSQISRFGHLSNSYITDVQIEFTEKLLKYSGMGKAFLTNSGTEAVEGAVKLIRMLKGSTGTIFSMSNSFHGRTYGALTLTNRAKYQSGFEPLLPGTGMIRFNDIEDLEAKINSSTAAVILEFLQGEGGINEASPEFISKLDELRNRYGFPVVSDCIQCGTGRTGKPYAHNYYNFEPDIIVTAKAIGGGLPLGAILVKDTYEHAFTTGKHGTTFGGNPVSCAAGLVVLREVYENGKMQNAAVTGEYLKSKMSLLKEQHPDKIRDVRGKGFMLGVELSFPGDSVVQAMFDRQILTNCTNETVIRLLPPLITEKEQVDYFCDNFNDVIKEI